MAKLNPVAADDESDFTFFQLFTEDGIVNVSIACELVDRIAGEKLGEHRRLQFLRDQSDLFSSVVTRRLTALGFSENIMLDETDFPQLPPKWRSAITEERAILAGGCFWGMQQLIRRIPGVISTRVGYSGGDTPNATYRNHGDHAEAIEIIFDPDQLSFRQVLEFFFQIHDPTTIDRQGGDRGRSYRSAIFYTTEAQQQTAQETILDVEASGLWPGEVVTELAPAGDFWEAEPEHQDYLERRPSGYTCHFIRPGWKLPVRADAT